MNLKSAPATILLGALSLLVITALAWVGLIGPTLDARGATDEARVQAQDRNEAMRLDLARLRKQAEDVPQTDKLAAELDEMFPATADQPGFFAQISDVASSAGVSPEDVTVLSPGVPVVLGAADAAVAAPADPATPADPAAATDPAAVPAANASDVAVQQVTIGVKGDYAQLVDVLKGIERMPRAFLVSSISISADEEQDLTLSVVGSTFVAPPLKPEES